MNSEFLSEEKSFSFKLEKTVWILIIVIWEQIVYTVINMIFQKSKFLNLQRLYRYLYTFTCIYCLFSGILMPNFALRQAFSNKKEQLASEDTINLAAYLIDGVKMNFIILIFSAANYKLLQPILLRKGKEFIKYLKSRKHRHADFGNFSPENIFVRLQILKEQSEKTQQIQEFKNSTLIFSLCFTTSCIITVAFYGLLIPSVVYYILPAMIASFLLDYYRFKQTPKDELKTMIQNIRKRYMSTVEKIKPMSANQTLAEQMTVNKKVNFTKKMFLLKKNKYCRVQRVPTTIFINFLNVLTIMTMPSCLLGYYGMTIQFQIFMQGHKKPHKVFFSLFSKIFSNVFYSFKSVVSFFNQNPEDNLYIFGILRKILDLFLNTLKIIVKNPELQILCVCYLVFLVLYRAWFKPKTFLKRTQRKIWRKNDDHCGQLSGESFRKLNPAYWM